MENPELITITEQELGITEQVELFEEAYLISCQNNFTDSRDHKYFRRYLWTILSLQLTRIDELENLQERTPVFPACAEINYLLEKYGLAVPSSHEPYDSAFGKLLDAFRYFENEMIKNQDKLREIKAIVNDQVSIGSSEDE